MKLNADGVALSILILILMIVSCHTMNYLYPKDNKDTKDIRNNRKQINTVKISKQTLNNFFDIPNTIPTNTNYNKIYYQNQNKPTLCDNVNHANIPCKKTCKSEEEYTLSDSELAFLYKYAYEEAGNEILMRELNKD